LSHRWVKYGIAGAIAGAAGAYAWKWAKNYRAVLAEKMIEAAIMDMVPEDVIPGSDIDLADVADFDAIVTFSCMDPCCYTPLSATEVEEYGFSGPGEYLDFGDDL
jgi:hypothetical protein